MKRFVAILMAAAMLLTVLAGCSGSTKPADTTLCGAEMRPERIWHNI